MTYTTTNNITLLRSRVLTDWNDAETRLIFNPPEGQNYSKPKIPKKAENSD